MKKKEYYIIGFIGFICIFLIVIKIFGSKDPVIVKIEQIEKKGGTSIDLGKVFEDFLELKKEQDKDLNMKQVVQSLRGIYGDRINNKGVQIAFIEELMAYLQKKYPDDWVDYLYAMIKEVFPEYADDIFQLFKNRYEYGKWLEENRESLTGMSRKDRREMLWKKREEIFGKETTVEIWEAELKNDKIYDAVDKIKMGDGATLNDKLSIYQNAVNDAYKDNSDEFIANRKQQLMDVFLNLDAVQNDLSNMSSDERKDSLKTIRKSMGLDNAALKRWDELDRVRDERWGNGMNYMKERENIYGKYKGNEREQKMTDLRKQYFGSDSESIKNEEDSGFFRFNQKRKYGKN